MPAAYRALRTAQPDPVTRPALRVLILDDERFDRHRLGRLCSGLDLTCTITNAQCLQEFGPLLDHTPFDLILIDYALPDGTGLDALRMARFSARNLNAPTLMISGQAADRVATQAQNLGCAGYLAKDDLTPDSFAQAVYQALGPRQHEGISMAEDYATDEVAQLISLCATRCAWDVKPIVSRMMRQIRDLQGCTPETMPALTQALEQNCYSLWSFLIEMEREDGRSLMKELVTTSPQGTETLTPTAPVKTIRPPSPFGRRPKSH